MANEPKEVVSYKTLYNIPDIVTIILAGVLFIQETVNKLAGRDILVIYDTNYKEVIISSLLIALVITLFKKLGQIDAKFDKVIGNHLGIIEVLKPHQNIDIVELLKSKSKVRILTLSGSTTVRLSDDLVLDILKKRDRKSNVTILLANPFSDAIINRYNKDEPDTCEAGVEGIKKRLVMLYKIKNGLSVSVSKRLDVRVFDNYPTISVIQGDKDVYSSVYAFKLRGSDCPIVHAETGTDYGDFIIKHFDKICDNSMKLENWLLNHKNELNNYI